MALMDEGIEYARRTEILFNEDKLRANFDDFVNAKLTWTPEVITAHRRRNDPWTWWGLNPYLVNLAAFARRVLSIPASSAASE